MKKTLSLILAVVLILAVNAPAVADMSMWKSTAAFIAGFDSCLNAYGLPYWPMELKDNEKDKSSVMKLITDDISLLVYQENGAVTEFQITTHINDNDSDDKRNNLVFCMMAAMMIADLEMNADDVLSNLNTVVNNREATINGVYYRYVTTAPLSDAVAFKVAPAEE